MSLRGRWIAALAAALLAGCASTTSSPTAAPPTASRTSPTPSSERALYVANQSAVNVYDPSDGILLRRISNGDPRALAFDAAGDLFVANDEANTVTAYASGGSSVSLQITEGLDAPKALAFDASGNLYVANSRNKTVTVYAPPSTSVVRTISDGINGPQVLLFDASGNLYVGNDGSNHITVFPPGGSDPIETISTHNGPLALAFGPGGYLFCVNNFNVTIYQPGATKPTRTISDGISLPSTLAIDSSGNLYVANWGANMFRSSISIYPRGQTSPSRAIDNGVGYPLSLLFDSSGNLYVANSAFNTVTEYAAGSSKLVRTLKKGLSVPSVLGFGP